MKNKLYKQISSTLNAFHNCQKTNNTEWEGKHKERLESYNDCLPHDPGFDSGCKIDIDNSKDNKIIIYTSYHFMDENGFYDGWKDYKITITASLYNDFDLTITGSNRQDIKDYMYETFDYLLREEVE
jgi:hypothetical protein